MPGPKNTQPAGQNILPEQNSKISNITKNINEFELNTVNRW